MHYYLPAILVRGLRDYGLPPLVWGGEEGCGHEWEEHVQPAANGLVNNVMQGETLSGNSATRKPKVSAFCLRCSAWRGSLGLEPTPDLYVAHLVEIFREVRRVLRSDGVCWLNMGDCYHSGNRGGYRLDEHRWENSPVQAARADRGGSGIPLAPNRLPQAGLKDKDLVGMPWRLAFALQADGWWLRADVIWSKPNPMPESVTDRPTKAHEYVFLLTKSERYYYDAEAVKESGTMHPVDWNEDGTQKRENKIRGEFGGKNVEPGKEAFRAISSTRNLRSVWTIATEPFHEAHFATFPTKLVETCVKAGTSERGACAACGAPWGRVVEASGGTIGKSWHDHRADAEMGMRQAGEGPVAGWEGRRGIEPYQRREKGWEPTCGCCCDDTKPCLVLDPFCGSGTVPAVAESLGRVGIGVELKTEYLLMAKRRAAQAVML